MWAVNFILFLHLMDFAITQMVPAAPPPPPPPGRGFQLTCSDHYVYLPQPDAQLLADFRLNAPPGFEAVNVAPQIFPGKNAHRYLVTYRSQNYRNCEQINQVRFCMSQYKPQNCNVGGISVTSGGFMVEYYQFCQCARKGFYRRRRRDSKYWNPIDFVHTHYFTPPEIAPDGNVKRCDDRDLTCGAQNF